VLRNAGTINPESLAEYTARGGYTALENCLRSLSPEQVIDQVTRSGLRGRGGGGFPAGRKWQAAREAPGEPKYLICNGDEGDPGAYMDRTILESDPHSVIEGMSARGLRRRRRARATPTSAHEYPLAVEPGWRTAVRQARERRTSSETDILGTGFSVTISTSRMRSRGLRVRRGDRPDRLHRGRQGEPRPKPPYPAACGLWGCPTVINNVKTWATVPVILARGPEWYASLGAPQNAGTVVFSLVGDIANTGLVEVPLGMTLGSLLEDIGGGSGSEKKIKAVQTGGPSGGCLPASLFDTPITYEAMKAAGSIMGSGGMVVMDESACMVDVARYFLEFTSAESCGKCTPCREGTRHMLNLLERITHGLGKQEDLDLLLETSQTVQTASLCGLGQTAPNPVLSTLRYFRSEYEAHVFEHRCPAGKCPMNGEVQRA
jgi:NADP-reducing hydrogenase subunit HndC